jgi:hypothetical protein
MVTAAVLLVMKESFLHEIIDPVKIIMARRAVGFIIMYMQMLRCLVAVLRFLKAQTRMPQEWHLS